MSCIGHRDKTATPLISPHENTIHEMYHLIQHDASYSDIARCIKQEYIFDPLLQYLVILQFYTHTDDTTPFQMAIYRFIKEYQRVYDTDAFDHYKDYSDFMETIQNTRIETPVHKTASDDEFETI